MDFTSFLPEECVILIISLTSPQDACRSALVSKVLRSAANSDEVWKRFLPCDYEEIVSGSSSSSSSPSPTLLLSLPKKDLYFRLSFNPILIENGTKSFQLEKESGKKCYMIGTKALSIARGDTPRYWRWRSHPDSRFSEVAELISSRPLDIKGKINTRTLSSKTNYAAYFVFKSINYTYPFRRAVDLLVNLNGINSWKVRNLVLDLQNLPPQTRERGDGWMEIEMGEFFNECGDDGTLEFSLCELSCTFCRALPIIEGIELRPNDIGR